MPDTYNATRFDEADRRTALLHEMLGSCGEIRIGSRVLIGPEVRLFAGNHSLIPEKRIKIINGAMQMISQAEPIEIGDDVWIGACFLCFICKKQTGCFSRSAYYLLCSGSAFIAFAFDTPRSIAVSIKF